MSDLPKDAPGVDVEPSEPAAEPEPPPAPNAHPQGDDLTPPARIRSFYPVRFPIAET